MAWMVDFRQALRAGMALRVDVPLAAGGSTDSGGAAGRRRVAGRNRRRRRGGGPGGLLDAHHYTDGYGCPLGYADQWHARGPGPRLPAGSVDDIFRVEGDMAPLVAPQGLADVPGSAGRQAAALLGVPNATFAHVDGADALTGTGRADPGAPGIRLHRPLLRLLGAGLTQADTFSLLTFS